MKINNNVTFRIFFFDFKIRNNSWLKLSDRPLFKLVIRLLSTYFLELDNIFQFRNTKFFFVFRTLNVIYISIFRK